MPDAFMHLISMSLQGGILILFLLLLGRFAGRRISPQLRYALWLLPVLRLLVPFSFSSIFSLMNLFQKPLEPALPAPQLTAFPNITPYVSVPSAFPAESAPAIPSAPASVPMPSTHPAQSVHSSLPEFTGILFWIWLGGTAAVFSYMVFVNLRFYGGVHHARTRVDCTCSLPVYLVGGLPSPCLSGLIRPAILINDTALQKPGVLAHVLRHEFAHYAAGDQWWALLRNLCCAVHWFNPLVWVAAFRSRNDCELACDARALRGFSQREREAYGMALLAVLHPGSGVHAPRRTP
ncbi:MAG: hypothetical protein MRZ67_02530 [Christensenella sp.]|jgi:beta-lactamase regulating signal transducer with metallopeptidase domain|nr:hypothetical protein [Christensenella sp.]